LQGTGGDGLNSTTYGGFGVPIGNRALRNVLKIAALLLLAVLTAVGIQFGWAYYRAPQLVERFERSTPLRLDPAEFGKTRLKWLLAVQDPTFYRNDGVDGTTPGAGYTTIAQAIVKFVFYKNFRPGLLRWRKIQQILIALAFNARVSKEEQLRLFVNGVYLGSQNGHAVRGFAEASDGYFGKSFARLSDEEYLQLVAMILAPKAYSLSEHPDQNRERVQRIKRLLAGKCRPTSVEDVEYSSCAG
jgi:membrane carboxypeptidase/penicillin-binding protein